MHQPSAPASFAARLADMPPIDAPAGWAAAGKGAGWNALARATPAERQPRRWAFAASLIAHGRSPEALGALDVMVQDDPDLALVPVFQLARGAVLADLGRAEEALGALALPSLAANPEACAWRLRAYAEAQSAGEAIGQFNCALSAINARPGRDRSPFVLAAAQASLDGGNAAQALRWLAALPDRDAAANLMRGRTLLALKQVAAARLAIGRAALSSDPELRTGARLASIELALATRAVTAAEALKQLDALRYGWRGGEIEHAALERQFALADEIRNFPAALAAGAALIRYFKPGAHTAAVIQRMQAILAALLAPDSSTTLPDAAGLYWDYREFAPAGSAGDALVSQLADRLDTAGLPARAADLLDYQLSARTEDVARGPLSVRVATLRIRAGQPDRAITMLRASEDPGYSDRMRWDRKRVEAVALYQSGKADAAIAALQEVPGTAMVGAEIRWKQRDWSALAASDSGLPAPRALSEAGQTMILRHAVALAMLGREDRLKALRIRYANAFRTLPSAGAFDVLTQPIGAIDPATVAQAMAAIPSASPAGAIADLLDVERAR